MGRNLAAVKERALHEYRDESWRVELDLGELRATEGGWHVFWRFWRRQLRGLYVSEDTRQKIEPFLNRWREPITRHGGTTPAVDRTRRTMADAPPSWTT